METIDCGNSFNEAIQKGDYARFRELVARVEGALEPGFAPSGLWVPPSRETGDATTLWQALVAPRPVWLAEVISSWAIANPGARVSLASALRVVNGVPDAPLVALEALASVVCSPTDFAEEVAAWMTHAAYLKGPGFPVAAAITANKLCRWALRHGATLEGKRLKKSGHPGRAPTSSIAHVASLSDPHPAGLIAWIRRRGAVCPLDELDAALASAATHVQAQAYALLAAARSSRPDGAAPFSPASHHPMSADNRGHAALLVSMFKSILSCAGDEATSRFVDALKSWPVIILPPGPSPYAALLKATAACGDLFAVDLAMVEDLCLGWHAAGIIPAPRDRAPLARVSPRVKAVLDGAAIATVLPSTAGAAVRPRF